MHGYFNILIFAALEFDTTSSKANGFNVATIATPTNSSQKVEPKRMRGRNRVIGGFNVTDIGNDANALAKMDKKNEKHAFPWMVQVFGDCGSM